MRNPDKKVTRKELLQEPDRFITFSGRLIEFGRRYQRPLVYSALTLLALVAVFTAMRYFTARAENKAFALLDAHTAAYRQALGTGDPSAAWEAVHADFEALIRDYGGQTAGRLARIRYGDICYAAEHFDQAIGVYRQALEDFAEEPFYRALLLNGLGHAYQQKQEYDRAVEFFRQVVEMPEAPLRDEALFVLAAAYTARGDDAAAQAAYRRIRDEFPESNYAAVARERLRS